MGLVISHWFDFFFSDSLFLLNLEHVFPPQGKRGVKEWRRVRVLVDVFLCFFARGENKSCIFPPTLCLGIIAR